MDDCPQCGLRDIRIEVNMDGDVKFLFYRCKDCGFQWDEDEIILKLWRE